MRVAVVTDSTAGLPAAMAAQWRFPIVPVKIRIDDTIDFENRIPQAALLDALRAGRNVSTAPPEPAEFYRAYQRAIADGADTIVSVHISARQSKTCEHAREAAGHLKIPVHVIDSGTTGMTLGYATAAAARVAGAGGDLRRVVAAVEKRLDGSAELIYVDTLEYLRKAGRVGAAQRLVGTALGVKPLLTMRDGEIAPLGKGFGTSRALRKLVENAVRVIDGRSVDVAIGHFAAPEQAYALLETLKPHMPQARELVVYQVSAALAVNLGPGALGIAISPA